MDCGHPYLTHGCAGGLIDRAFHYAMDIPLQTEDDYPYKAKTEKCHNDVSKGKVQIKNCIKVEPSVKGLM